MSTTVNISSHIPQVMHQTSILYANVNNFVRRNYHTPEWTPALLLYDHKVKYFKFKTQKIVHINYKQELNTWLALEKIKMSESE